LTAAALRPPHVRGLNARMPHRSRRPETQSALYASSPTPKSSIVLGRESDVQRQRNAGDVLDAQQQRRAIQRCAITDRRRKPRPAQAQVVAAGRLEQIRIAGGKGIQDTIFAHAQPGILGARKPSRESTNTPGFVSFLPLSSGDPRWTGMAGILPWGACAYQRLLAETSEQQPATTTDHSDATLRWLRIEREPFGSESDLRNTTAADQNSTGDLCQVASLGRARASACSGSHHPSQALRPGRRLHKFNSPLHFA